MRSVELGSGIPNAGSVTGKIYPGSMDYRHSCGCFVQPSDMALLGELSDASSKIRTATVRNYSSHHNIRRFAGS